ncbi:hypothetical protein ACHAWF_008147 [Thalassiosira exigua]
MDQQGDRRPGAVPGGSAAGENVGGVDGTAGGGAAKSAGGARRDGADAPPDRAEATKRLAQQGQWRTPPLPAFARAAAAAAAGAGTAAPGISAPAAGAAATGPGTSLPATPDEYARMLQEAYKRGAEAGARSQRPGAPAGVGAAHAAAPGVQSAGASYTSPGAPAAVPSNPVSHSKSMPDMSAYHQQARHAQAAPSSAGGGDDEEDKRKRRLARNRASARLRRLKKKNLVDSYEGEVGILESSLSKLRSHRWGATSSPGAVDHVPADHEALIEALSMERGQQPLTPERRREMVRSILAQQREQVANLLECQLENWVLGTLASSNDPGDDPELAAITSELRSTLNLTPQQLSLLEQSSRGCAHEIRDLLTVDDCLRSLDANGWLLDEGVDEVAGQFTNVLNPTQLSKFLMWSDHNADQIERLDYVNANSVVGSGPAFEFGVDEGLADGD